MTDHANIKTKTSAEEVSAVPLRTGTSRSGLARVLVTTGALMSMALPLGVVPRLLQQAELNKSGNKEAGQLRTVTVKSATSVPREKILNLPGTIEAIVETPIYARTNGYIRKRFVDISDKVQSGQLLADIETPEVEQSEREARAIVLTNLAGKEQREANKDRAKADVDRAGADLASAKATLVERERDAKYASSTYSRWHLLGDQGAVSQQDVEEKETKFRVSQAAKLAAAERVAAAPSELEAAKAKLKAEQANVNASTANVLAAEARSDKSTTEKMFHKVASPFTGVIVERNIDEGMLVSAGSENSKQPLYRVARLDIAKVFVDIPQFAASSIKPGQAVSITLKEQAGSIFEGKIARTSVALDPVARTLRTEVHVPNPRLQLIPGMYADVNLKAARDTTQTVLIPANSLVGETPNHKC